MNKANLKSYAPKARLDFIKAVTERANVLGISAAVVVPAQVRGDVALIDGREWPTRVAGQRDELIARIKRHGFEQTMDEVAYTWFNRFAALRYMEIHDYLGHGWRVLSSRDGGQPEILRHASEITLQGLDSDRASAMHVVGNQDNELYKLLLVAQCNELSRVMPFLFERIDDETELLLPENLLRTDSIVAKLVESVPEEDWQEIEVIGWLYQFYISEKKDQVMGKVVKSEDIPAATQLFTPNWIVQYLVQNSVGRLWLLANPGSALASQWPYYIEPAAQTPEVQAQLDALIQTRIREDGETLNPETITVLDPACGSGHILVVAYDVLKAIYLERGYQLRTIPRLILEKNLYGLDIDDRAGQLAAFALVMKARADDRRLFSDPPKCNVLSLQESDGLDVDELISHLASFGLQHALMRSLFDSFESAKTIGSLLKISPEIYVQLPSVTAALQRALDQGDLYARQAAKDVLPLVNQAMALGPQVDAVVTNPPYMGRGGMNPLLKSYGQKNFPASKADLYAMFIDHGLARTKATGFTAMVTMQSWMFISSFEEFRENLLSERTLRCLIQIGYNSFPEMNSKIAQGCAFSLSPVQSNGFAGSYINLNSAAQSADKNSVFLGRSPELEFKVLQEKFSRLPGHPIAYWASDSGVGVFEASKLLRETVTIKQGMTSGNNAKYLRYWHEIAASTFTRFGGTRWHPFNKGGEYRRWYGNNDYVINYEGEGSNILADVALGLNPGFRHDGKEYYGRDAVTWSAVSSSAFCTRLMPPGFIFGNAGPSAFGDISELKYILGLTNSKIVNYYTGIFSPTLNFEIGDVGKIPVKLILPPNVREEVIRRVDRLVALSKEDWDSVETSWDFIASPLLTPGLNNANEEFIRLARRCDSIVSVTKELEEQINRDLIRAYGLQEELLPDVAPQMISLRRADPTKDSQRLISYSIGCMMGRYSLDEPGLIYAHAGNAGFDASRYEKFPADEDGILPITEEYWLVNDAASRVRDFLCAIWGAEKLEENLAWLAGNLGTKGNETPDETVRRYLADKFFKDHLQTYKKRPIYWLFSSGKQGAFQVLVYLHRYNEGTLARMRAEYLMPLIAKVVSRLETLSQDLAGASSAAARSKLQKQMEVLRKQQLELLAYDEKLRHYADMRITLDLDDGVKVNYGKFGDLLEGVKLVTGGGSDD